MNTTKNKIASSLRIATIDIDGILGTPEEEQFGMLDARVATYERFEEALAEIREEGEIDRLVLNIRSTGGCLADALLIYDTVRSLGVEVVTRCYGYVASAATIIAQAASKGCREISANALYLIHCCESAVEGNTHSLSATKELLDKSDERLAEIYALASSRTPEEYRELMNRNSGKGVWLSPEECVKVGLADSIIASSPITDSARGQICTLGLTPLPAKSLGERIREAWGQLLSQVGLGGEDAVALAPVDVSASKAEDRSAGKPPVPPSRLHTARPTLTKECDDPAPNGTPTLTANQAAYESDVAELKRAMNKQ